MTATTLDGVLLKGVAASRPAASAVAKGTLYSATDTNVITQSDGVSTWSTFVTATAATRASLGLDTTDSPQFAGVNVGHATDTTLARVSAGILSVEGNRLFAVGAADVPIADGGTGQSTKAAAFDALSPMSAANDLIIGGTSGTGTRLATVNSKTLVTDGSGVISWGTAGGGGGLAQSFVGYNTIGGTWTATVAARHYVKKITLAADSTLTSIDVHLRANTDNFTSITAILLTDAAGVPDLLIGATPRPDPNSNSLYFSASASMPTTGRWFSMPMGAHLAAGDYWIGFVPGNTLLDIANDGSGSDVTWTAGLISYVSGSYSGFAKTTGSVKYSIRASILA